MSGKLSAVCIGMCALLSILAVLSTSSGLVTVAFLRYWSIPTASHSFPLHFNVSAAHALSSANAQLAHSHSIHASMLHSTASVAAAVATQQFARQHNAQRQKALQPTATPLPEPDKPVTMKQLQGLLAELRSPPQPVTPEQAHPAGEVPPGESSPPSTGHHSSDKRMQYDTHLADVHPDGVVQSQGGPRASTGGEDPRPPSAASPHAAQQDRSAVLPPPNRVHMEHYAHKQPLSAGREPVHPIDANQGGWLTWLLPPSLWAGDGPTGVSSSKAEDESQEHFKDSDFASSPLSNAAISSQARQAEALMGVAAAQAQDAARTAFDTAFALAAAARPSAAVNLVSPRPGWSPVDGASERSQGWSQRRALLSQGVEYAFDVELELPLSTKNRNMGVFMLELQLSTMDGAPLGHCSQPVIVPYTSSLLYFARELLVAVPVFMGLARDSVTVQVSCFQGWVEIGTAPLTHVLASISTAQVTLAEGRLNIRAVMYGLAHVLHTYFISSWVMGVALVSAGVFSFLLIAVVVAVASSGLHVHLIKFLAPDAPPGPKRDPIGVTPRPLSLGARGRFTPSPGLGGGDDRDSINDMPWSPRSDGSQNTPLADLSAPLQASFRAQLQQRQQAAGPQAPPLTPVQTVAATAQDSVPTAPQAASAPGSDESPHAATSEGGPASDAPAGLFASPAPGVLVLHGGGEDEAPSSGPMPAAAAAARAPHSAEQGGRRSRNRPDSTPRRRRRASDLSAVSDAL